MVDNKGEKEIDLLELARKLWDNKRFILKVTLIGAVFGLIIAFSIPKEYTTTVVFTTNSNDTKAGNMGAIASLAGINLNGQPSEIFSPDLYPDIVKSTPFVEGLLNINVKDRWAGIDTTLYSYLKDEQKSAWWSYILGFPRVLLSFFKSENKESDKPAVENPYFISEEEIQVIESLKNSYTIDTDKKTGISTFEIATQSPDISALLADTITSYLQLYIINERTKKAKTDLENSNKLYEQAKADYYSAQKVFASFLDRNKNISSATYAINQKKLEDEANLAFSVYTQMAQQLQINKVKVQDDTPVFTVIQPSVRPIYPSSPNKKIILAAFIFIGILVSSIWLLRKDLTSLLKD